jgi:hypothetical protein
MQNNCHNQLDIQTILHNIQMGQQISQILQLHTTNNQQWNSTISMKYKPKGKTK